MGRYSLREAIIDEMEYNSKTYSKTESAIRDEYLEEMLKRADAYERYIEIYDVKEALKNKGIELEQIYNIDEIRAKWDNAFTNNITLEQKSEVYFEDFKWHVFSYELLPANKKDDADNMFLEMEKGAAYLFGQFTDECFVISNASYIGMNELELIHELLSDFYLFDTNGNWTYIRTHEPNLGPFLHQIK